MLCICSQPVLLLLMLFCGFSVASGLPHSFIIMHQNRYQQCIGAFILQAASESAKVEKPQKACIPIRVGRGLITFSSQKGFCTVQMGDIT